ncbi:MAG: bifunctional 3-(3-hydroxy-phenyl)propionate/3-hydroxycinnamic acid hydroxylase [Pseudomonadota bacterium]
MQDPDVLIIGMGPVGAILANLCARDGLRVMVVERDYEVYKQPRAIVMDHEVLRQMNFIDCAEDVLACSEPGRGYSFLNADREILTQRSAPDAIAPTGYAGSNLFHQPSMEKAVRAKLELLDTVEIRLGVEFIALHQDADSVLTTFRLPDGSLQEVKAKYLVGCDGGRSLVRRYLDIQMEDLNFNEPWVVVDVKLLNDEHGLSDNAVQLCDPARPTTSVPSGPGRHRWEFMVQPGETAETVTRHDVLTEWISAWTDPRNIELERSAFYRFHGLVAKQWRKGRAMIVGDAAHQMPPFMGQGLCAGARDVCNLAWKLSAVDRAEAPLEFLDTVEDERSPHVKAITESAIAMGKTVCVTDPDEAAARDAKMIEDHRSGAGFAFPGVPRIKRGVLQDKMAGAVFPEGYTGSKDAPERLDSLVGYVPLLVLRDAEGLNATQEAAIAELNRASANLRVAALQGAKGDIVAMLDPHGDVANALGADPAMLVKPDRIVFGQGSCQKLAAGWTRYLSGELIIDH